MTERIIALRPHHIDRFIAYYHGFYNMFDNPSSHQEYGLKGTELFQRVKDLFELIASGGMDEDYILVINKPDSICEMCTRSLKYRKKHCSSPDSFSGWDVRLLRDVKRMNLKEGFLYTIEDFVERVKKLYPDRNAV